MTECTVFRVQGSGKSHTVATMLESMLIPKFPPIGSLAKALCGLVLHYGEGGSGTHPSEAAWLGTSTSSRVKPPPVKIYVSHASLRTMQTVYEPLGSHITVEPLYFKKSELDAAAFLSMMAVGTSDSAPLYMQVILVSIVRRCPRSQIFHISSLFSESLGKTIHTRRS